MAERPSPVQKFAQAKGLTVRTPSTLKSAAEQQFIDALNADAAIVVAYGLLLPKAVLEASRLGCFNVHASLLPRWRGAAPIQRAIMAGDKETGVSIMRIEEGLDTGPVCKVGRVLIKPDTTAQTLHDELAKLGAGLMVETLAQKISCRAQASEGVTYARKIGKEEARIDFRRSGEEVHNHIHGLSPFPGAWFNFADTRIKVLSCEVRPESGVAGTFIDNQLTIACGKDAVRLTRLQREGKAPMVAAEFLRGFPIAAGSKAS
jgi:methionyl-tRNA formyltransferase